MTTEHDTPERRQHRARNTVQALAIIGSTSGLVATTAYLIWGAAGAFAAIAAVGSVALLASAVPATAMMRLYRGRLVPPDDSQLSSLVDVLAFRASLPVRPALYIVPSLTETAFTTGNASAPAIAVTEGLLRKHTLRETAAIVAHEIGHIYNDDLEVLAFADVMSRLLLGLAYVSLGLALVNLYYEQFGTPLVPWAALVLLYVAPALGNLVQLTLSRVREHAADEVALALTGDPHGIEAMLAKATATQGAIWEDLMFPVPARRIPEPSLLRSHPTSDTRLAHLMQFANAELPERIVIAEQPMISLVGYSAHSMRPRYRFPGLWY